MNEGFTERIMDRIMRRASHGLGRLMEDTAVDIKDSLSTECPEFHTGHGGHSHRGQPPFSETGTLAESIDDTLMIGVDGKDTITGKVSTNVSYAPRLEKKMDRPFFGPAFRRMRQTALGRMAEALRRPI